MAKKSAGGGDDFGMIDLRVAEIVRKRMVSDRREVAGDSHFHPTSVEAAVKKLCAGGVLESHSADGTKGNEKRSRGRPPQWLTLAPELGYLIGLDMAHDGVTATVTGAPFNKVLSTTKSKSVPELDDDPDAALEAGVAVVREAFAEAQEVAGATAEQVIGIGVGLPAPVNRWTKKIESEMHILSAWSDVEPALRLKEGLADVLPGVPVEVDNDASLGALGVYSWQTLKNRPGRAPKDLIYVRVGSGIGAGLVFKGKLLSGGSGFAGEVGHIKVNDEGGYCRRCGQRGCVETQASEEAVLAQVADTAFGRSPDKIRITEVLESEHPVCVRVVQEAGERLGVALAHARTLLDPSFIYVGGQLANPAFLSGVRLGIIGNSISLRTKVKDIVQVSPPDLPDERGDLETPELLGALAIALHRCGDEYIKRHLGIDR